MIPPNTERMATEEYPLYKIDVPEEPETGTPDAGQSSVEVVPEQYETNPNLKQMAEREQSLLERFMRKPKAWAAISAFVLVTGIVAIREKFSRQSLDHTNEHAAQIVKEKIPKMETPIEEKAVAVAKAGSTFASVETKSELSADVKQKRHDTLLREVRRNPSYALENLDQIKKEPYARELIVEAARLQPDLFVGFWPDLHKALGDISPVTEAALLARPSLVTELEGEDSQKEFKSVLDSSSDPRIRKMAEVSASDASPEQKERLLALIDLLSSGTSLDQAKEITGSDAHYIQTLIKIAAKKEHLGNALVTSELRSHFMFPAVAKMNALHEVLGEKRFVAIKDFNPTDLYMLLVLDGGGVSENDDPNAYPSTYQGVFDRMLSRMQTEHLSGNELLAQMGSFEVDKFVSMSVQRGRFDDFLKTMDKDQKTQFVKVYFEGIGKNRDPRLIAGIGADVLKQTTDPELLAVMSRSIQDGFTHTDKEDTVAYAAYGVMSLLVDANAPWVPQAEREAFRLQDLSKLEMKDLESGDGVVVERYYFYNDEDGQASFANFVKSFQGRAGWKIEHGQGYVVVSSKGKDREMKIFANEPSVAPDEEHPDRPDPVETELKKSGLKPTIVVHRGHIYHQEMTIDRLPDSVKLLVLGSCGGYATADKIMAAHPDIQMLSTKKTGTKLVNDTILRAMEDEIRDQEEMRWSDFWKVVTGKLGQNPDFGNYVSPDRHWYATVSGRVQAFVDQKAEQNKDTVATTL